MRWWRWGPFLSGAVVSALAAFTGSHGWRTLLVGAAAGVVWAVARTVGERVPR